MKERNVSSHDTTHVSSLSLCNEADTITPSRATCSSAQETSDHATQYQAQTDEGRVCRVVDDRTMYLSQQLTLSDTPPLYQWHVCMYTKCDRHGAAKTVEG